MTKIPFLLLGDGPAEPTGLGRIARDLAGHIITSDLPLDLVQVGGSTPPVWSAWRHVPLERQEDWGAKNVEGIYRSLWDNQPGILMAVWDPARLYYHLSIDLPVQRWGYCAIDGANWKGQIGGPAGETLRYLDRVLAYNRYGAEVIKATTGQKCSWIPHGIHTQTFMPVSITLQRWAQERLGPHAIGKVVIGSVMTNQARKDFGLLFAMMRLLRIEGLNAYLWLHTDEMVKAWSVQQLVDDYGLARQVTVTGLQEPFSDQQMAALYQQCAVTVLPSMGEGFGYPIVESLASGVPCVHSQWAAGEIYVPKLEWKVPVRETRIESVYGIERPVMKPEDWRNATLRAVQWAAEEGETGQEYCRGAVANLDWRALWGRWSSWIKAGLR
jgi:glycosyltransferase involved in cell wall biosynthesis